MSKCSSVALICSLLVVLVQAIPDGRILGGWPALPGQFPYQVSVKFKGEHNCGGSIISKYYILTAAHCVLSKRKKNLKYEISSVSVQAGTTYREDFGIRIPVAETIVHPRYIYEGFSADIALVRLGKPLTFSETIKPIALSNDDVPENTPVVVSGWGRLRQNGSQPNQLQWTVFKTLSRRSCDIALHHSSENQLCLGHPKNKGACNGDSGGPAVVGDRLVGVASFYKNKCGTDQPDGYVKVSRYLDWIKKHSDVENVELMDLWKKEDYDE